MIAGGRYSGYTPVSEATKFLSRKPRNPPNYVLVHDDTYINTCPAGIEVDPADSTKRIFYRGEFLGATTVGGRIGAYRFTATDPYTLGARLGTVLSGSESYDIEGCRFGCSITVGGVINYFYPGVDASFNWRICRATMGADGLTPTKLGVVLDFNNVDEKSVSDPSIYFYNGTYYMVYTAWDGVGVPLPNNNPGRSMVGMKLATSTDLQNWTKTGTVLIPIGTGDDYDAARVEGGTLFRIENRWFIIYNCFGGPGTDHWSIQLCYHDGDDPDAVFIKTLIPYFERNLSGAVAAWDSGLVACPLLYPHNGELLMYYQALSQDTPTFIDIGLARII